MIIKSWLLNGWQMEYIVCASTEFHKSEKKLFSDFSKLLPVRTFHLWWLGKTNLASSWSLSITFLLWQPCYIFYHLGLEKLWLRPKYFSSSVPALVICICQPRNKYFSIQPAANSHGRVTQSRKEKYAKSSFVAIGYNDKSRVICFFLGSNGVFHQP